MPTKKTGPATSDAQLAQRAQSGCLDSFAELVARYQVSLLHYLRQRTGSVEDAEDVLQDVFVRAFEKICRYRSDWPFGTWLFTLARRQSIDHFRRQRRRARSLVDVRDPSADPAESAVAKENGQSLWSLAAATLTESQWSSLWLFYVEGLSVADIARILRSSPGAIKARMHRARRKLRRVLTEQGEGQHLQPSLRRRAAIAGCHWKLTEFSCE